MPVVTVLKNVYRKSEDFSSYLRSSPVPVCAQLKCFETEFVLIGSTFCARSGLTSLAQISFCASSQHLNRTVLRANATREGCESDLTFSGHFCKVKDNSKAFSFH